MARLVPLACALALLAPATAGADAGWTEPERTPTDPWVQALATAVDGSGATTIAWSTASGIYAADRKAQTPLATPQRVASGSTSTLKLAVNPEGEAILAWAAGNSGAAYASIRPKGGSFGPPQLVHDPAVDTSLGPAVAIAPGGWATVAIPSGDLQATWVAAFRPPGGGFGPAQRVKDDLGGTPHGLGLGIDARGDAVVAYRMSDCPNLPPDYRCEHPIRTSIASAGGTFTRPASVGQGRHAPHEIPKVAVTSDGAAAIGFVACLDRRACADEAQVVSAKLPSRFGPPHTLNTGGFAGGNETAVGEQPWLMALSDGSILAWQWSTWAPDVLYARHTSGGAWDPVRSVDGVKRVYGEPRADADGDVVFFDPSRTGRPGSCSECDLLRVQHWSLAAPRLTDPVALSAQPAIWGDVAVGPGDGVAAAWAEGERNDVVVVRIHEEIPQRPVPAHDATPPVIGVVSAPRKAAPVVALRATCDESCTLTASGTLRAGHRAFALRARERTLRSSGGATLRLASPSGRRGQIRRALRRSGPRTLSLRVTARDLAGNRRTLKRKFRLARKS